MKTLFLIIFICTSASTTFGQGTIDVTPERLDPKAAENLKDEEIKKFAQTNATTWLPYQARTNVLARRAIEQGFPPNTVDNSYLTIIAGAYLLNPYRIGESNRLEKSDAEAPFFIQFAYDNVWAWNAIRRQYGWDNKRPSIIERKSFIDYIDLQGKLSVFLHSDSDKTNVSTIVGSGDFAAEGTFTFNIWESTFGLESDADESGVSKPENLYSHIYDRTIFAQSYGPCISYSGVTDRSAFDLHSRVLIGTSYKAAMKLGRFKTNEPRREGLISINLGYAWIDQLQFVSESSRVVKTTHDGVPDYKFEGGFAVEADVYYPIGKDLFLTAGTRIYAMHDPNPWSAQLSITWSVERLLTAVGLAKE